jgi:hypothetical protein
VTFTVEVDDAPGLTVLGASTEAVSEKSGGSGLNVAVTNSAAFIVTVHVLVPEQEPPQPAKVDPDAGVEVSVTAVPVSKLAEHSTLQSMPAGLLVTVPLPLPASATESVKVVGAPAGVNLKTVPAPVVPPFAEVVPYRLPAESRIKPASGNAPSDWFMKLYKLFHCRLNPP